MTRKRNGNDNNARVETSRLKNIYKQFKKSSPSQILILFLFVIVVNVFFLKFYPADGRIEIGDTMAYHTLATNIKEYGTFGERFHSEVPGTHLFHSMPSGENISTTFRPPGYPAFLALLYLISESYYFIVILQSLLAIFSLFLLFKLIKKYFSHKVAVASIAIYSLLPAFYQLNISFWSESFTQSLLVISISLAFLDNKKSLNLIFSALLFSFVILSRPTYAIYLPIILIIIVVNYLKHKTFNRWLTTFFIVTMIPIIIWSVRCSYITKKPVFISSTTGINFFLSNNPYVINGRASTWPSADYLSQNEINVFRNDYNDADLNQLMTKSGLRWIKENPIIFLKLIPNRIVYFFAPINNNFLPRGMSGYLPKYFLGAVTIWSNLLCYFILFFSIIGVWYFPQKKLLFWFLPYLAVIAVTYPEDRYFFPFILPMSLLAVYGLIGLRKIKKNNMAILIAILLTYWQISYFGPKIYRQYIVSLKSYSSYIDLIKYTNKNPQNYYLTDAVSDSKNEKVVVKKEPTENSSSFELICGGITMSEGDIISKIESGQFYTDLINPFSGLDKNIYPQIADQNNLIFDNFEKKSIFKLSKKIDIKSDENFSPHVSDRPNQAIRLGDLTVERGKEIQIEVVFSSRGKVMICSRGDEYCFGLLYLDEADNFSTKVIFDTNKLPSRYNQYEIGLVNNVNFPIPNDYNILYTGNRANFVPSGVLIKEYGSK